MANVLNRIDKRLLYSVNTPDFDELDWIINPDMSSVEGVLFKYWVIEGDSVRAMTVEERAAYDAANVQQIFTGQLSDGTPARQYMGYQIAINSHMVRFFAKTKGSRNFNLLSTEGSKDVCYWGKPQLITSIMIKPAGTFNVVLDTQNGQLHSMAAVSGEQAVAIPVAATDILSCRIESSTNVADPEVLIQIAQRGV